MSDVAISKIYAAYGGSSSNTVIMKKIQNDKKNGGHPDLK